MKIDFFAELKRSMGMGPDPERPAVPEVNLGQCAIIRFRPNNYR